MTPEQVYAFRKRYNSEHPIKYYSGHAHYFLNVFIPFLAIIICLANIRNFSLWELLAFPLTMIIGNLVVYIAHRWVLHIRLPFFPIAYNEHTLMHHFYFTHQTMELKSNNDILYVLFKPYAIILFLVLLAAPMSLLLGVTLSVNFALIVYATSSFFFILYETFHLIYHLDPKHKIYQYLPFMIPLREHHQIHHDIHQMKDVNFNIIYPLFDWIFKTKLNLSDQRKVRDLDS